VDGFPGISKVANPKGGAEAQRVRGNGEEGIKVY
jgi:hypothetical protein